MQTVDALILLTKTRLARLGWMDQSNTLDERRYVYQRLKESGGLENLLRRYQSILPSAKNLENVCLVFEAVLGTTFLEYFVLE